MKNTLLDYLNLLFDLPNTSRIKNNVYDFDNAEVLNLEEISRRLTISKFVVTKDEGFRFFLNVLVPDLDSGGHLLKVKKYLLVIKYILLIKCELY